MFLNVCLMMSILSRCNHSYCYVYVIIVFIKQSISYEKCIFLPKKLCSILLCLNHPTIFSGLHITSLPGDQIADYLIFRANKTRKRNGCLTGSIPILFSFHRGSYFIILKQRCIRFYTTPREE